MRTFGLDEANALVPTLQTTFRAVRDRARKAEALTRQLAALGHRAPPGVPLVAAATALERDLASRRDALFREITHRLDGLGALGLGIGEGGEVDFPARLGGRTVALCWRPGEEQVAHWHEHGQHGARRPIRKAQRFEPAWVN